MYDLCNHILHPKFLLKFLNDIIAPQNILNLQFEYIDSADSNGLILLWFNEHSRIDIQLVSRCILYHSQHPRCCILNAVIKNGVTGLFLNKLHWLCSSW